MNRDPFAAIADPTRREIIGLLATEQPMTMGQLAENFSDISRQAVGKQVKYLEESGLIRISSTGRERYCYLQPERLAEVQAWIRQYEKFWNSKLDQLGEYLDSDSGAST